MGVVMGVIFVIIISDGSCFGYQKPIEGQIWLKFDVWSPNSQVRIINHIRCGLALATPRENYFAINNQGPTRLKFGM